MYTKWKNPVILKEKSDRKRGKKERVLKEYEAILEIINQCPQNKDRDVFFEEIETDDVENYVKMKFREQEISYEKIVHKDGTIVFEIMASGIHQRYTFTEI